MPKYGLVSLGLIIVFLATAHIFSYKEAVANGYKDVETYYFMAGNGFDESSSKKYLSHHLERWPLQLLVGYLSKGLNIDIWTMYRVLVLVLIAITYYVIRSLNCPVNNKMAIFSLILFNPYTFRSFYAVPGMISDCTLYVGLLFVVCGIINKVGFQVFLGVFLSVISRQTSILLIPIFITLYYFKYLTLRNLIIYCFVMI